MCRSPDLNEHVACDTFPSERFKKDERGYCDSSSPLTGPQQTSSRNIITDAHAGRIFCEASVAERNCHGQTDARINKGAGYSAGKRWNNSSTHRPYERDRVESNLDERFRCSLCRHPVPIPCFVTARCSRLYSIFAKNDKMLYTDGI